MPSLYKRGDHYYVAFYDATRRPKRKHISLRASGYRAAQLKSARLVTQYEEGSFDPWSPRPEKDQTTLGDAVQQFLKTRQNLSGQSIQKYKSVLGQLVKFMGADKGLDACSPTAIQAFIDSGNRRPITKKTYSTTLSPFFNWCKEQLILESNPVVSLRLPKIQDSLPKVLTQEQVTHFVATVERYDRECRHFSQGTVLWMIGAVKLALSLGLRAGELCQLQWADIDFETNSIRVGGRRSWS